MAAKAANLPAPSIAWIDEHGRPTAPLIQFMAALAALNIGPLVSAASDSAAASAGVPINGLYQNSGSVRIRLT